MNERRVLEFSSLDEALADAEQLATGITWVAGKHSHAEIVRHLALTLDIACGHSAAPRLPWFIKLFGPLLKKSVVSKPAKPGLKLPPHAEAYFWPDSQIDLPEAMEYFRESMARYRACSTLPRHPIFGNMTREELDRFQCHHMALHLSFVHPGHPPGS